eukprot:m.55336 g.55336  ORF g.55336 m.55336 type:complete len:79 (-) comp9246_c0_seq2:877-1113(-)
MHALEGQHCKQHHARNKSAQWDFGVDRLIFTLWCVNVSSHMNRYAMYGSQEKYGSLTLSQAQMKGDIIPIKVARNRDV